ncbi:MAG: Crp/Fnr family transcriptional regulator [Bacteroidetes bacterium]|nr:Crp/Fnr family transcriptional regulator [Bacteroidota bacterium]
MPIETNNIKTVLHSLNERTKELNCLYLVDEILQDFNLPLESVFSKLNEVIPKSMQYVDICRTCIIYDNKEYVNETFKKTELKLSAQSFSDGKKIEVCVYYIKPVKIEHRTIFLSEEHKLINTVTEKIARYIEYRQLRDMLNKKMASSETKSDIIPTGNLETWLKSFSLSSDNIQQITRVKIIFRKGETICKQGALTNHIMLLSEGLTKIYLESSHDRNFIIKIAKPFDFIGLSSLYGENTYTFSASALVPCSVYLVEKETLKNIFFKNPDFAYQAMKWFSQNFSLLLDKMSSVSNKQSLGRMSDVLLYLAKDIFSNNTIEGCISRKDIAELAGLSTESAVRILSDFKSDSIVTLNRNEIQIVNEELLRTISMSG